MIQHVGMTPDSSATIVQYNLIRWYKMMPQCPKLFLLLRVQGHPLALMYLNEFSIKLGIYFAISFCILFPRKIIGANSIEIFT